MPCRSVRMEAPRIPQQLEQLQPYFTDLRTRNCFRHSNERPRDKPSGTRAIPKLCEQQILSPGICNLDLLLWGDSLAILVDIGFVLSPDQPLSADLCFYQQKDTTAAGFGTHLPADYCHRLYSPHFLRFFTDR